MFVVNFDVVSLPFVIVVVAGVPGVVGVIVQMGVSVGVEVVVDVRDGEVEVAPAVIRVVVEDKVVSLVRGVADVSVVGVFGVVDVKTCAVVEN